MCAAGGRKPSETLITRIVRLVTDVISLLELEAALSVNGPTAS